MGIDEQELIKRAAKGQKEAFPPLVEKYSRLVYTAALRIVRDPFMAEDIAQEAFLQAYRSLASFRHESSFSTWLTRIVVNKSLDHCRRTKHLPSTHDPRVLSNNKVCQDPGLDPEAVFWKRKERPPSEKRL